MAITAKVMAPSGRWAIFAREDETSPWVQIESVRADEEVAEKICEELEEDDNKREEYILDSQSEDWGEDAATPPAM